MTHATITNVTTTETAEPARTPAQWRRTVTFPVTVSYTEHYTQSPRHRRTLSRRASLERGFAVRFVERVEAPVALMTRCGESCIGYRRFEGVLYRELRNSNYPHMNRPVPVTLEGLIETVRRMADGYGALDGIVRRVEHYLETLLCVADRLYECAPEPLLSVEGGRLEIVFAPAQSGGGWKGLYNALEREAAMRETQLRRRDRGDPFPSIHVFDREAVQHPSHREWLERAQSAKLEAAVGRVRAVVGELRRPERRAVLERLLQAA